MIPVFALAVAQEVTFWQQPIDVVLFDLLVWFGWIPIAIVMLWGFAQLWLNHRGGLYASRCRYSLLAINVPSVTEQTPKALEMMFDTLYGAKSAITVKDKWMHGKIQPKFSLEIASTEGYIQFYIYLESRFRDLVEASIYAQYPDAEIVEAEDYMSFLPDKYPDADDVWEMWGAELKLDIPNYFPIRTYRDFEDRIAGEYKDPLAQVLESIGKMEPGEHFWIQLVISPHGNKWKNEGVEFINKKYGVEKAPKKGALEEGLEGLLSWPSELVESAVGVNITNILFDQPPQKKDDDQWRAFKITLEEKTQVEAVMNKIMKNGYQTKVRILYVAKKEMFRKWLRAAMVKSIFNAYGHVHLNSFKMYPASIPRDDYSWQKLVYTQKQDILAKAVKTRSFGHGANPMVLNTEELASLWHFPAIEIKAPLIRKIEAKRAEPPVSLPFGPDGEIELGVMAEEESKPKIPMMPLGDDDASIPITLPHDPVAEEEGPGPELEAVSLIPEVDDESVMPNITLPTKEVAEEESSEIPPNLPI
mgnify:CR=1 FL=1